MKIMPESFDRGALTEAVFYILLSLYKPMHGYAIMLNIEKQTGRATRILSIFFNRFQK